MLWLIRGLHFLNEISQHLFTDDPRVQYWEPTKFAATVRYQQRDRPNPNPVLLQIDSSSGHFSASDRYKHLKQRAFEYAVLLDQLGLTGTSD